MICIIIHCTFDFSPRRYLTHWIMWATDLSWFHCWWGFKFVVSFFRMLYGIEKRFIEWELARVGWVYVHYNLYIIIKEYIAIFRIWEHSRQESLHKTFSEGTGQPPVLTLSCWLPTNDRQWILMNQQIHYLVWQTGVELMTFDLQFPHSSRSCAYKIISTKIISNDQFWPRVLMYNTMCNWPFTNSRTDLRTLTRSLTHKSLTDLFTDSPHLPIHGWPSAESIQ